MGTDISIIIPNYNKGEFVAETINSIISQTFNNWEIIFVDDYSTDNSVDVVNSFDDNRIHLTQLSENKGASYCRNYGFSISKGEYVIFLDSDDILINECLSKRFYEIKKNPKCDFLIFRMAEFTDNVNVPSKIRKLSFDNFLYNHVSLIDPWGITQPIWKKVFLDHVFGFNVLYGRFQDVEFHTRVLLSNPHFKVIEGNYDFLYRTVNYQSEMSRSFANNYIVNSFRYINEFKEEKIEPLYFRQLIYSTLVLYVRANQMNILSSADKGYFHIHFFKDTFIRSTYSFTEFIFLRIMAIISNQRLVRLRGVTYINKFILGN